MPTDFCSCILRSLQDYRNVVESDLELPKARNQNHDPRSFLSGLNAAINLLSFFAGYWILDSKPRQWLVRTEGNASMVFAV